MHSPPSGFMKVELLIFSPGRIKMKGQSTLGSNIAYFSRGNKKNPTKF